MRFLIFVLFCLLSVAGRSQSVEFKKIKGLPTEEVYDVFSDSKGFIWVAHSLGISRYDGQSFTHFQKDDHLLSAVTNICEDKQGKIWFHDFNGKIFYIANEKVFEYKTYSNVNEVSYPTIIINGDTLFITSSYGLFLCNTLTLKGRYVRRPQQTTAAQSIAVCNGNVLTFDRHQALVYKKDQLIPVPIISLKTSISKNFDIGFNLAPLNTRDTLYGYNNNLFITLTFHNDTLRLIKEEPLEGMINTVTISGGEVWVHTKKLSVSIKQRKKILNKNLTDYITDKFGNIWAGSLQLGLLEIDKYSIEERMEPKNIEKNDFIRCITSINDEVVLGTQNGKVIVTKRNKKVSEFQLPPDAGSVEHIFTLPGNQIIIAPSVALYYANLNNHYLFRLSDNGTVKDFTLTDTTLLFARSSDVVKISISPTIRSFFNDNKNLDKERQFTYEVRKQINGDNGYKVVASRCYYINFHSTSRRTFGIFKNGFGEIINDSLTYWKFDNNIIQASCFIQNKSTLYIASQNQGLLIYKDHHFEKISLQRGLFSNTIMMMKIFGNDLILIEPNSFQIWNLEKREFTSTLPLPSDEGMVYDFIKKGDDVYLTFTKSVYRFSIISQQMPLSFIYLLEARALNSNTFVNTNSTLDYHNNNIQISVASPVFIHPEAMRLVYRLKGDYDSTWRTIFSVNNRFNFASLKSGNYTFECYSLNFQNFRSPNVLRFNFTIGTPWFDKWWFRIASFILIIIVFYAFFRKRLKTIKARDQLEIDKLTLQNDLRKSLLRTIIAQMNPHFIFNALNTIQSFVYKNDKRSVSNYMGKFSELIRKILHSSNIDSISLGEEIEILNLYLELEKARFENEFHISLKVDKDINLEETKIPPMFIQPYIENAIKHGLFHKKGFKELSIAIEKDKDRKNYLLITVDDNGIGREHSCEINSKMKKNYVSFASSAMSNRINLINQTLNNKIYLKIIDKPGGEGTLVRIELPLLNKVL